MKLADMGPPSDPGLSTLVRHMEVDTVGLDLAKGFLWR